MPGSTASGLDPGPKRATEAGHDPASPDAAASRTSVAESDIAPLLGMLAEAPADAPPLRLVAAFDGAPPSDQAIAASATLRLAREVTAGPLFSPDPELDRFRLLRVPGLARPERADLFDLAATLQDALGAVAVEPDLGTDYYAEEPAPGASPPGLESADLAGWCWADPEEDKPTDADWAMRRVNVREAWAMQPAPGGASRGRGILIFQPDTGIVPGHVELPPDLATHQSAGNFVEGGSDATDPRTGGSNPGHGTATASVAVSPESGEMAGAAPEATLVPVRCIETVAVFDQSPVAQAIDHARRKGAHVITMSLGGIPSMALHAALRRAIAENVIVLAAAGNCVGEVVWPARYDAAIAVAGMNEVGKPWRGSSHGPDVDIAGPAEFVLRADGRSAAVPPRGVGPGEGTSFATALIAGIAALWLAHHGRDRLIALLPAGRTLQDMFRALLQASAEPLPDLDPQEFGPGLVRADRLLAQDPAAAFAGATEAPLVAVAEPTDGLASLLWRTHGSAGQEAAGIALLPDRQHVAEIACLALDSARRAGRARAYFEALPPAEMSVALRRRLGPKSEALR
jgi:serine protease